MLHKRPVPCVSRPIYHTVPAHGPHKYDPYHRNELIIVFNEIGRYYGELSLLYYTASCNDVIYAVTIHV